MPMQFVTDQFKDANITTAKIADDGVTAAKINLGGGDYAFTNGATLSWAGTPTATDDVTNKAYVDAVASGLDLKESVMVASTGANLTLSGTQTIDGVAVTAGKRVLVKDQTDLSKNGIYVCAANAWSRASDFATGDDEAGAFMFVEQGTINGDNGFVCTNNAGGAVVGTNDLVFTQFSGAGQITAGDGLSKTGNTLAVRVDDASIEISNDVLNVKASGITNAMLAGSIGQDKLAGSIPNAKLANSSVSFGGISLALGASDATPAFDLSDATAYPTSSLVGTITNAQLAGSIADSKLSTISTAGKVALSAIDIDGGTDIGAALVDADLIIVDDGAGGTNRKATMERVSQHGYAGISGNVTINSEGVSAIGSGAVANAMLANSSVTVSDGTSTTAVALGGTITFTGTEFGEASGTISLAADAVKFSNLKVRPGAQGAGGDGSTAAFVLGNRITDRAWDDRVLVFRNGQLQQKVSSFANNDSSEYTVTDNGSATTVTFGAAPLANEVIFISYLYEG